MQCKNNQNKHLLNLKTNIFKKMLEYLNSADIIRLKFSNNKFLFTNTLKRNLNEEPYIFTSNPANLKYNSVIDDKFEGESSFNNVCVFYDIINRQLLAYSILEYILIREIGDWKEIHKISCPDIEVFSIEHSLLGHEDFLFYSGFNEVDIYNISKKAHVAKIPNSTICSQVFFNEGQPTIAVNSMTQLIVTVYDIKTISVISEFQAKKTFCLGSWRDPIENEINIINCSQKYLFFHDFKTGLVKKTFTGENLKATGAHYHYLIREEERQIISTNCRGFLFVWSIDDLTVLQCLDFKRPALKILEWRKGTFIVSLLGRIKILQMEGHDIKHFNKKESGRHLIGTIEKFIHPRFGESLLIGEEEEGSKTLAFMSL